MDVKNTHSVTKTEISVFGRQALDAERRRSPSLAGKVLKKCITGVAGICEYVSVCLEVFRLEDGKGTTHTCNKHVCVGDSEIANCPKNELGNCHNRLMIDKLNYLFF